MSRDFLFSAILHIIVVGVIMLSPGLRMPDRDPFGEVIRVNAVSMPPPGASRQEPEPLPELETPAPVGDEPDEVPISDPTTRPEAKINKPVEKPKPKPKPDKSKQTTSQKSSGQNQDGSDKGTDVEAPAGTSISGVRIDNSAFNYPYWFTLAWNKINQNFRIPVSIDGKVYCDVHFQVIKSGRVIEAEISKESGIPMFDRACLSAIEDSSPFPPLPREFLDEIIGVTITFQN